MDYRAKNKEAIRLYIEMGFKIFPVDPATKRPLVENGFYEATNDLAELEEWWRIWPDASLATPMGFGFGKFVYDVDPSNGGIGSHRELVDLYGELPPTWTAISGSGGAHSYFRYPQRKVPNRKGIRPGLDIQSDGSYILLPFSLHPSGNRYLWKPGFTPNAVPLADAPTWLLEIASDKTTKTLGGKPNRPEPAHDDDRIFPQGTRENNLVSLIGTMNRRGISRGAIVAALTEEDRVRCRPPLGPAEVEHIIDKQLTQYKPDPEAVLGVSLTTEEPVGFPDRSGLEGVTSPDSSRVEEIISSLIGKGTTTLLAASWKSGKTFLTYRILLDALAGKPVLGVFHVERPLKICMLQMEMPLKEDERRMRRLAFGAGLDPSVVPGWVQAGQFVHYSRPMVDLTTKKDVAAFLAFAYMQQFDLVVIDSVVAAFAGTDINSNPLVRQLYKELFIPLTSNGISNLLLHHYRKSGVEEKKSGRVKDEAHATILGAQTWGAASDRIFTLEGVMPKAGKLQSGELMLQLNLIAGWAPSKFEKIVVHLYDDGDATLVEIEKDVNVTIITSVEQALRDIGLHYQKGDQISQAEMLVWLASQGYPRRVAYDAKDLACSRGILRHVSKMPVVFERT